MRTRFYNPLLKRFMNADIIDGTIADSTTLNLYTYVNGNPISYVDPFGLSAERGQQYTAPVTDDGFSWVHTVLDIAGFIPVVGIAADGINAIIYVSEGDWLNAGLSAGALVPVVGDIAASGKAVSKGVKVIDKATDMAKVVDKLDDVNDTAKAAKKVGWHVGDDITNLTKAGNDPSWTTVRQRYWKNEAYYNPDLYSKNNLERMKQGLAPQVEIDGKYISMELHHKEGRDIPNPHDISNLQPLWPWEHAAIDPNRHYTGPRP